MKPIIIIEIPIELQNKENLNFQMSQIKEDLEKSYHVIIYFDNECKKINFKLLIGDEINPQIIEQLSDILNKNIK